MDDLKKWMMTDKKQGKAYDDLPTGKVGIFDATNTTPKRRAWIKSELYPLLTSPRHLIFVGKSEREASARVYSLFYVFGLLYREYM